MVSSSFLRTQHRNSAARHAQTQRKFGIRFMCFIKRKENPEQTYK